MENQTNDLVSWHETRLCVHSLWRVARIFCCQDIKIRFKIFIFSSTYPSHIHSLVLPFLYIYFDKCASTQVKQIYIISCLLIGSGISVNNNNIIIVTSENEMNLRKKIGCCNCHCFYVFYKILIKLEYT